MAITAEMHDGTRLEFPDGTDPAVIQSTVQRVLKSKQPQAAQQAGSAIRDIPRQVGLTARYGIEGLGNLANVFTEPVRQMVVNPLMRAAGAGEANSTGQLATSLADAFGLPQPRTANERVVGDMTRTLAGAGGMVAGASRAAASMAPGVAKNVVSALAARPGVQAAGAVGAGGAGGAVREAGGGDLEQFGASLLGGITAGSAAGVGSNLAQTATRALKSAVTPKATELARADQTINLTLQRSGVDWGAVPERVRQSMREDVAQAMNTGQPLNADAMRRLLVFRSTGTTPTVGQLTQDPGQITREMNLAKTAANMSDPALHRLPALQNQNTAQLLRVLDESGAARAPSAMGAGQSAIESLDALRNRAQGQIGSLYNAARDTSGRSLPLEGGTFTRRANELLDEANVGSFLPADIAKKMNAIAQGQYPLTVDVAEQLKTSIGNLQRGSNDGNMRRALGIVRQALDEAPLQPAQKVNPGNLPAVPGTVPPSPVEAGQESINAFNAARRANREWMQRVEGNPALRAVVDGVEPDQFVQRFIIGKGASAADVQNLRGELQPQAVESMRQYLVRYLRDAATGGDSDIVKFGGKSYRDAFRGVEDKLPAFFSQEEIRNLRNVGDAAKYMQAQPAGSAVNNSNSGALVIGKGLDILQAFGQKAPLGLSDTITGVIQGMQQRQVMAPRNALMLPAPRQENALTINPLLAGAVAAPEQNRKNKARD